MDCPFCDHSKSHKHGTTSKGSQRYRCAACHRTFTETFDTLYYRRQVTPEQVEIIFQSYTEGSSLRGISRIGKRAYGTVVDIVRKASYKAQLVHNEEVKDVECAQITADEMWSFCKLWCTDDWGGYKRVLPAEVTHCIDKEKTQRLERTNGIVRQQTGRWHRRQNKFSSGCLF